MKVWNIGLPRTGSTSTTNALNKLGFKCTAIFAMYVDSTAEAIDGYTLNPEPPLLVCSVRDYDSWAKSMRWMWPERDDMGAVWEAHQRFLERVDAAGHVYGTFRVTEGYSGLWRAMTRGFEGRPLPHLNASR